MGAKSTHSTLRAFDSPFRRVGEPGLEILDTSSICSPVPTSPLGTEEMPFPPILVNIGHLIEFSTNAMLKGTVHPVVFPEAKSEDRYRIANFCHPPDHVRIEAVPSRFVQSRNTFGVGKNDSNCQKVSENATEGYL